MSLFGNKTFDWPKDCKVCYCCVVLEVKPPHQPHHKLCPHKPNLNDQDIIHLQEAQKPLPGHLKLKTLISFANHCVMLNRFYTPPVRALEQAQKETNPLNANSLEVDDACVLAFDTMEDGKLLAKDFPVTENHQAYNWHDSIVNIITDDEFKENIKNGG